MKSLEKKYTEQRQYLERAVSRLGEVLAMEHDAAHTVRDSAIQRFEFCFDLSWKTMKTYLQVRHGIACASPKTCLREAAGVGLLRENHDSFWLTMLEMRNLTSHTYNEQFADDLYSQLQDTHTHFLSLLKVLD